MEAGDDEDIEGEKSWRRGDLLKSGKLHEGWKWGRTCSGSLDAQGSDRRAEIVSPIEARKMDPRVGSTATVVPLSSEGRS